MLTANIDGNHQITLPSVSHISDPFCSLSFEQRTRFYNEDYQATERHDIDMTKHSHGGSPSEWWQTSLAHRQVIHIPSEHYKLVSQRDSAWMTHQERGSDHLNQYALVNPGISMIQFSNKPAKPTYIKVAGNYSTKFVLSIPTALGKGGFSFFACTEEYCSPTRLTERRWWYSTSSLQGPFGIDGLKPQHNLKRLDLFQHLGAIFTCTRRQPSCQTWATSKHSQHMQVHPNLKETMVVLKARSNSTRQH